MEQSDKRASLLQQALRRVGPAIVVACVVLGPGSILTSSKIGCQFGYELVWLLAAAGALMMVAIATAASIGVTLGKTPCQELAARLGRPVAIVVGGCVFLMAACFQFSNNLGVLAAIEPLVELTPTSRAVVLGVLNTLIVVFLFGLRNLYLTIERGMMLLVGVMLLGFAANLLLAQPSVVDFLRGLLPSLPDELSDRFWPTMGPAASGNDEPVIVDPWVTPQGLVATTFSVAGAFYQAYLVREKGWTRASLGRGLIDPLVGTAVLVGISAMIMATAASVLRGKVEPSDLGTLADVAGQLRPLFGAAATGLFCLGVFAGAISSFLVNSMIGGTLLADGLGQKAALDSPWPKNYTVLVLLIGMIVALLPSDANRVPLIIFAHALTVLGGPLLAASLLYLATRRSETGERVAPLWLVVVGAVGFVVVLAFAARTVVRIYLQLS